MKTTDKAALLRILKRIYPEPKSELNFRTPFELIVSVILSAQCTDKKVNETTPTLFARYPDFEALRHAKVADVEKIIRPINYFRTKAKNVIAMSEQVVTRFKGEIPRDHASLQELSGVGRKTANVVLGELGITPCIPVDTHVFRVAKRLGLSKGTTPDRVESDLREAFPSKRWYEVHHWFIFHGRRVCKAQRPLCSECRIRSLCPSSEA